VLSSQSRRTSSGLILALLLTECDAISSSSPNITAIFPLYAHRSSSAIRVMSHTDGPIRVNQSHLSLTRLNQSQLNLINRQANRKWWN